MIDKCSFTQFQFEKHDQCYDSHATQHLKQDLKHLVTY